MVYPDGESSPHFERLVEGIQDFEKARIMMKEWSDTGNTATLDKFKETLKAFNLDTLLEEGAAPALRTVKEMI